MSRQPKLFPKTHIPGFPENWYDFAAVARLSEMEYRQGIVDDKPEQRVFRVKRKHVLKACDRCRLKKTKCDGKQPCNRCSAYNHPCLFREKKATQTKVYSRGFVEMLESHHSLVVKAMQQLYKHCVNKEGFPGEPLAEGADGHPLTHDILDRLGLIKQAEENTDEAEEESEDLRYLRNLSTSTECSATTDPSPEPVTPPEPSSSTCSPIEAPLGTGEPLKWGLQFPSIQATTQADQYHNFPAPSNHHQQGMIMSRPSLVTTSLGGDMSMSPASCPSSAVSISSAPGQNDIPAPYLYYAGGCNGQDLMKNGNRMQSPPMNELSPHQMAAGLPADTMFNEYHLSAFQGQQQQQQQQQSLYANPLAPGWTFPA